MKLSILAAFAAIALTPAAFGADICPHVTKITPGWSGETNVPINTNIQIDFDANPATIGFVSIVNRNDGGDAQVFNLLFSPNVVRSGNTATLTLFRNLKLNSSYLVLVVTFNSLGTLTEGMKFCGRYVTFDTKKLPMIASLGEKPRPHIPVGLLDLTAPTLVGTIPGSGQTNVSKTANLVMSFSEKVQPGTGVISIHRLGDFSNFADFSPTDTTQVTFTETFVTINPSKDLEPNTTYYVTMDGGAVLDLAGNPAAGIGDTGTFAFTTAP